MFTKPRVLGLYAERYSFTSAPEITLAESKKQLEKLGYDYILQCDDLSNPPIDSILRRITSYNVCYTKLLRKYLGSCMQGPGQFLPGGWGRTLFRD